MGEILSKLNNKTDGSYKKLPKFEKMEVLFDVLLSIRSERSCKGADNTVEAMKKITGYNEKIQAMYSKFDVISFQVKYAAEQCKIREAAVKPVSKITVEEADILYAIGLSWSRKPEFVDPLISKISTVDAAKKAISEYLCELSEKSLSHLASVLNPEKPNLSGLLLKKFNYYLESLEPPPTGSSNGGGSSSYRGGSGSKKHVDSTGCDGSSYHAPEFGPLSSFFKRGI